MITTIQIHENVKEELEKFKETSKETYEEVILKLMEEVEQSKRKQKALLIEGYKDMAEESIRITKRWASIDKDWD